MSNQATQEDIDRLIVIGKLKDGAMEDKEFRYAWKRTCERLDSYERRGKIMQLLQEALQQIRLDIKYLQFDLEATRRERDELKRRLGE